MRLCRLIPKNMTISARNNIHGRVNNVPLHLSLHIHLCFSHIYVVKKVSTFFVTHSEKDFFSDSSLGGHCVCCVAIYQPVTQQKSNFPWRHCEITHFSFFPLSFPPPLPSPSELQDKYHNLSLLSCLACGLDDILAMPSVFPAFSSLGQTQRASEAFYMSLTCLFCQNHS